MLGHANLNTTQRYLKPSSNAKRKLVDLDLTDGELIRAVGCVLSLELPATGNAVKGKTDRSLIFYITLTD
jgi:hypothetical protein